MKNKPIKIFLLSYCLLFFSCKKYYDEGPSLSFRTKKARVVNKWKIDKMYSRGGHIPWVKLGAEYEIPFSDLDSTTIIELKSDYTAYFTNFRFYYLHIPFNAPFLTSDHYTGLGSWNFIGGAIGDKHIEDDLLDKEGILLKMNNNYGYTSKILKLKENELWIVGYWPRQQYVGYPGTMPRIELRLIPIK
jgi:hypothetical protein